MSIFNSILSFVLNLYKPRSSNTNEVPPLKSEELYEGLAQSIVQSSLSVGDILEGHNIQYLGVAGAEVMYFLFHIFDMYLFEKFGPQVRDEIFDNVSMRAIASYGKALLNLKADIPPNIVESVCVSMMNKLNDRQESYSKCKRTCYSDGWPSRQGSALFALNFYIHKSMERTDRKDLDENFLSGKRAYNISDNKDFPDPGDASKIDIFALCIMKNIVKCWNSLFQH